MLNGPFNRPRPLRAACTVLFLAAACARPAAAQKTFVLPIVCKTATGDEGDDPVVLVSLGTGETTFTNFTLERIMPVSWAILIKPYQVKTYNIFTTYTPFLTSDVQVENRSKELPEQTVRLPAPGVSGGRKMGIWPIFTVTVMDRAGNTPVPNAFVDFIPPFVGSSPLTMRADGEGNIVLKCVQQVSSGYLVTVYGADHGYLYDGHFLTDRASASTIPDRE